MTRDKPTRKFPGFLETTQLPTQWSQETVSWQEEPGHVTKLTTTSNYSQHGFMAWGLGRGTTMP
jgi:hypothetical protein